VINRKGYDGAKADIWSCGVILFVMLAGHLPFKGSNLMEMYKKIFKADYTCPSWFPPEARKLLAKILDPNPNARISISKIMENPWFKKGLGTRPGKTKGESQEETKLDAKSFEKKPELLKPVNLNAFDIISLSSGFDLTGLFVDDDSREDTRFTSLQPASVILSKLEEVARHLKLKVAKREGGFLKLVGSGGRGGKGAVSIDADIFEFTPSFHLVEMKKSSGDLLDYQKVMKDGIQPALKDIVWAWQDNQMQQQRPQIHSPC